MSQPLAFGVSFLLGHQDSQNPMPDDLITFAGTLGMTISGTWSQGDSVVWYGVARSYSGEAQVDATQDQQTAFASWLYARADVSQLLIGNLLSDNSTDKLDPNDILQ
jgi:hypothetical protein